MKQLAPKVLCAADALQVHSSIHALLSQFSGRSLVFPVLRMSQHSAIALSASCSNPLCHRTLTYSGVPTSHIPMQRTSAAQLLPLQELTQELAQAHASASEGFIADMRADSADAARGLHEAVVLSTVGVASDVLQQAQAAWFQVFNQILGVGCRGCNRLNASSC